MEAKIQISGKGIGKVVGATCVATGVVALSALVASGAAVGAVANSFKTAKNIVKKILEKEDISDTVAAESGNVEMVVTDEIKKNAAECAVQEEEKIENIINPVEIELIKQKQKSNITKTIQCYITSINNVRKKRRIRTWQNQN